MSDNNMEIGIDCVDISRFEDSNYLIKNLKKIFTEKEISYCQKKENTAQHYAARFAAKEAVIKALSEYQIKPYYNQIEILNNKDGKPIVNILNENNKFDIKVSLSHSRTTAVAIALISIK